MNIHSSSINHQTLGKTQMSFNWWIVQQTGVHPYHAIPLSNKKEQTTVINKPGWISGEFWWVKNAHLRRLYTGGFHFCTIFLISKLTELEKRLVTASGKEWSGSRGWERTTKVQKEGVPWCHHSPDLDRGGGYRKLHMYYLLYMHIKKVLTNLGGPNKRCALYQCLFPSFWYGTIAMQGITAEEERVKGAWGFPAPRFL